MFELTISNLTNCKIACDTTHHVLKYIQLANIDWLQACGGKGRCTTCAMHVVHGSENLTPPTNFEQKQHELKRLRPTERLACQCKLHGNVSVEVPERLKLPHITYQ